MECSRIGKTCIDVSWSELDRTRADLRKKLEAAHDKAEKANAEVARYRRLLKHAQRRAEDKMVCLAEELNKETEERIARGDISDGEREDLEAERRDKEFLASLSVPEFQWEVGDGALPTAQVEAEASSSQGS